MELVTENPKISISEIAEKVGLSIKGVEKNIQKLKKDGRLARTSETRNREWIVISFKKEVVESETESRGKSRGIGRGTSRGIILELVTENAEISVSEIAEKVGLSIKGVEKNILQLKKEGKLSRTVNTKSGKWIVNV